ncbi:syntaxin-17 [Episyrphus balteatus]|uniref:syntaxin-17 n=1 Tax=Episyrphus balteatus TaxID=286459 RepID=UPI00248618DC|nr:syntaxin-17 [Episyrphus balteatus]
MSVDQIENVEKIPLKRAEVSIRKFNDLAIPHHLGLLKNHKSNIEKCLALGDWTKIKKEEINAMRVIKQLKNLMLEMDILREKVCDDDREKFDEMMSVGKNKAMEGMREYLDLQLKSPTSTTKSDDNDENSPLQEDNDMLPQIQADFQLQEHQLIARQACLKEFENLQREVQDLHSMFQDVRVLVHDQAESVQVIADNAEEALENVQMGESHLQQALAYKKAMYPVMGALLGTCVGGPIGLLAGIKAGGLAAVGCGILGFTGGQVLNNNSAIAGGESEEKKDE